MKTCIYKGCQLEAFNESCSHVEPMSLDKDDDGDEPYLWRLGRRYGDSFPMENSPKYWCVMPREGFLDWGSYAKWYNAIVNIMPTGERQPIHVDCGRDVRDRSTYRRPQVGSKQTNPHCGKKKEEKRSLWKRSKQLAKQWHTTWWWNSRS